MKLHGTYEAAYGIRITPILRYQAGQPIGRVFVASTGLNYSTAVTVLAEPFGTRRQDDITLFDLRAEKVFALPRNLRRVGVPGSVQPVQHERRAEHQLQFRHRRSSAR